MSEFISLCPPPGPALDTYDRTKPPAAQPDSIPRTFLDAMYVREEVFVNAQNVPLENELDADDARCWHWVIYASVASTGATNADPTTSSQPQPQPQQQQQQQQATPAGQQDGERRPSDGTATRLPIGTVRLVPPPHAHEEATDPPEGPATHPAEPYVKLGRLATLEAYRGLGLAKLLINAAMNWASTHPDEICPPLDPAEAEKRRLAAAAEGGRDEAAAAAAAVEDKWKGMVVAHAQTGVQGVWEKMGFVLDESMGRWVEENIGHVGMVKRMVVVGGGEKKV